jgi:acylglycerol lipase
MNRRLFLLSASAVVTGCAPMVQLAGTPELGFGGPRLEADTFVSFDGGRMWLKRWLPAEEPTVVVAALHGMNDYSNAFHFAAPVWAEQGIATYAYDQRGFGRSPQRGVWGGEALMTEDLRVFVELLRREHPAATLVVAGESMGGAVAIAAFASSRPPAADRLVLMAPAVWGWSSQPLPFKTALWITAHLAGETVLKPPDWVVDRVHPSDNHEELVAMGRDPMMIWGARNDTLYGLVDLMQTAWESHRPDQGPGGLLLRRQRRGHSQGGGLQGRQSPQGVGPHGLLPPGLPPADPRPAAGGGDRRHPELHSRPGGAAAVGSAAHSAAGAFGNLIARFGLSGGLTERKPARTISP